MKYVIYLRVSTDQQVSSGLGLEAQRHICLKNIPKNSQILEFVDEGFSGSLQMEKRPALISALNELSKNDILLVAKRDRLARGDQMALIQMAVDKKKAKIISCAGEGTEGDRDDPVTYMMRGMTDLFAGFERLLIKSRTKAALRAKKDRGQRVGHIPFGYRLCEDNIHLEKDDREQDIIKEITEMREDGLAYRSIANELNEIGKYNRNSSKWNHVSVFRIQQSNLIRMVDLGNTTEDQYLKSA